MSAKDYIRLTVKKYRNKVLPKIDRPWRPRVIAWAGPAAFYPNRFYEKDSWYKARIDKPERYPKLHVIEPTDFYRPLAEVLAKEEIERIDIGFKPVESEDAKKEQKKLDMADMEHLSRNLKLMVDFDKIPFEQRLVFEHYGLFDDLFGRGVYFESVQGLDIAFGDHPVCSGNMITPANLNDPPQVSIESIRKGEFNTLVMVNLDGNATEAKGEMFQWMITNIPDGEGVEKGDELIPYLKPLPFCGTGFHRIAFVMFRHTEKINLPSKGSDIPSRIQSFSTLYKDNEQVLTPSAMRFFQCEYDNSVKEKLHEMGLKSPIFKYEYREALKPMQYEFPMEPHPFDLYFDMYRPSDEVEQERLEERLQEVGLKDFKRKPYLDANYMENRVNMTFWEHRRLLQRQGRLARNLPHS
ncbi:hypothetical protein WR25_07225 [Diploscapter pachys]|uniref:39S ribosomal protein L38, mitochondrial n=1 Tax=Diploscapter pachys TaxID=2018661 RepID=A0A2A2LGV0_9BILA|nr:hypothetical protein WR25_07225 [Diploscapter pachys]